MTILWNRAIAAAGMQAVRRRVFIMDDAEQLMPVVPALVRGRAWIRRICR
jgi:HSP90 family molecular chaperone